jgi:hypothetical protein
MILHAGKVFLLANYGENGDGAVRKSEASVRICIDFALRLCKSRGVSYTSLKTQDQERSTFAS